MTAEEANKLSIEGQFRGVDYNQQLLNIEEAIKQACKNGLREIKFTKLHPQAEAVLVNLNFTVAKDQTPTVKISW